MLKQSSKSWRAKIESKISRKSVSHTISHFNENATQTVENNKTVLLKQVSRETMQIVTKES